MKIINLDIDEIKVYEKNPVIHSETQIENIMQSINEFGFKQPIVLNREKVIIIGHGRFEACKRLEIKEVPCVIADELTEEQVKKLRLADNKISELREWDKELLGVEITGLENLEQLGFSEDELMTLELGGLPESLEIEKEKQDISGSHVDKLRFGNCVVVMTEEERRKLSQRYDEYVNDKGTDYGFVTELLGE